MSHRTNKEHGKNTWEILVIAAFFVSTSLVFWRGVAVPFDLVKSTLGLTIGSLIVVSAGIFARHNFPDRSVQSVLLAVVALVISAATSQYPWQSLYGQYQRHVGVMFTVVCLIVALSVMKNATALASSSVKVVQWVMAIVVGYSILQRWDLDPFEWQTDSFGEFIIGTIGNPNTASAFVVVALPFLFAASWRARSLSQQALSNVLVVCAFSALGSFQSANVFLALTPIAIWLLRRHVRSLVIGEVFVSTAALVAVAGYFRPQYEDFLLLIATFLSVFPVFFASLPIWNRRFDLQRKSKMIFTWVALLVVLTGAVFWRIIREELTSGLEERRFFYQAAWEGFLERPVLGYGWETFGNFFSSFRTRDAASTYDTSLTSSVHSYPLGALFSGGLLLIVLAAPMLAIALSRSLKSSFAKASDDASSIVGVSFLAFLAQSLVNVEHPSLFAFGAILLGLNLGLGEHWSGGRGKARSFLGPGLVAVAISTLVAIFALRPLAADVNRLNLLKEIGTEARVDRALSLAKTSYGWMPHEPTYSLAFAEISYIAGDCGSSVPAAVRAVKDSNYNLLIVPSVTSALFNCGERVLAHDVLERGLELNPFSPSLLSNSRQTIEEVLPLLTEPRERELWQELSIQVAELSN